MKIKQFLAALVSRFNIGDLVDRIRNLRKTIKEVDIPLLATAAKELKKLSSPIAKKLEDSFSKQVKGIYRGTMIDGIYTAVRNSQLILDYLEELISTEFNHYSQEILKDGLTFKKANILQYVEVMEFFFSYSRRLVELLYVLETIEKDPTSQRLEDAFTPAELDAFDKERDNFIQAFKMASYDIKDLAKAFSEIPDAIASEDSERVLEVTAGLTKLDPFGQRNFFSTRTPTFWISLWFAELQVAFYNRALDQKKLVELRLLKLREDAKDGVNPKLESQIEYQEARLDKLNRKIRELEEKYA